MEILRNKVSWSGDCCCHFLGVENLRNEFSLSGDFCCQFLGVENLCNEFLGVEISVASFLSGEST